MAPKIAAGLGVLVDMLVYCLRGYGRSIFFAESVGDLLRAPLHFDLLFDAVD